ncbi:MAG: hypothetical protein ACTJHW_14275 [Paenalcaligenes sp.]
MRSIVLVFVLLFLVNLTSAETDTTNKYGAFELALVSSANAQEGELSLSAEQWALLRQKEELLLGVIEPGKAPVDIVGRQNFKGVSADVASLLGRKLHLKVRVLRYSTAEQAIDALQAGP